MRNLKEKADKRAANQHEWIMVDAYRNNFHLLRLILAALVMLSHGNYVFATGYASPLFHSAEWAVNGFFVISGLLISWSIDRRFEWRAYGIKRFARIYPLYAFVILAQLAVLLFFSLRPVTATEMAAYLAANLSTLTFLKPNVGDMVDFPFNGSLWTIKIEVMFYVALPFFVWFVRRFGLPFLLLSWLAAFMFRYTVDDYSIQLARQLPGAMAYFIAGYVLHHYGQAMMRWLRASRWRPAAVLVLVMALGYFLPQGYGQPLQHLALLMVIIYLAAFYAPPLALRYDISYGLYLIHFPFFATVAHMKFMADSPQMAFALACAAVTVLSFLSCVLIEEPAIRWGKKKAKRYETNRAEL